MILRITYRRHLTTRQFRSIVPPKFPEPPQPARQQFISPDLQNPSKGENFQIRHTALLVFKSGYSVPAYIPANQLQLYRKALLSPSLALSQCAHLWTNHVQQ